MNKIQEFVSKANYLKAFFLFEASFSKLKQKDKHTFMKPTDDYCSSFGFEDKNQAEDYGMKAYVGIPYVNYKEGNGAEILYTDSFREFVNKEMDISVFNHPFDVLMRNGLVAVDDKEAGTYLNQLLKKLITFEIKHQELQEIAEEREENIALHEKAKVDLKNQIAIERSEARDKLKESISNLKAQKKDITKNMDENDKVAVDTIQNLTQQIKDLEANGGKKITSDYKEITDVRFKKLERDHEKFMESKLYNTVQTPRSYALEFINLLERREVFFIKFTEIISFRKGKNGYVIFKKRKFYDSIRYSHLTQMTKDLQLALDVKIEDLNLNELIERTQKSISGLSQPMNDRFLNYQAMSTKDFFEHLIWEDNKTNEKVKWLAPAPDGHRKMLIYDKEIRELEVPEGHLIVKGQTVKIPEIHGDLKIELYRPVVYVFNATSRKMQEIVD